MNLVEVQKVLKENNLDGWIFADFRGSDSIAYSFLNISIEHLCTRRWFYFIPAEGTPRKLCNAIEPHSLDALPGETEFYMPWKDLPNKLKWLFGDAKVVAAQYSKNNSIPYISKLDAGMLELFVSLGLKIETSGNLISQFEAKLDDWGWESHKEAGKLMMEVKNEAFAEIGNRIRNNQKVTEYDIWLFIKERFTAKGLWTDHGPIVAINENAADPHFEPTATNSKEIKVGDLVLLDIFAKLNKPNSVWYDVTWMGFVGKDVPTRVQEVFEVNRDARNAALNFVREKFANGIDVSGSEIDDVARNYIIGKGLGKYFIHRTGHNISQALHGNGAHLDNFETNDTRKIIKSSCFSIEPGIYIPEEKIGFRSEIDVFIKQDGEVAVVGDIQEELVIIEV